MVGASSRVLRIADLDERISVENAAVMALAKKRNLVKLITPITRFCLTPGEFGRKRGNCRNAMFPLFVGVVRCSRVARVPDGTGIKRLGRHVDRPSVSQQAHHPPYPSSANPERERAELPKATTNGFLKFSGSHSCAVRSRRGRELRTCYSLVRSSDVRNTCLFQITYPDRLRRQFSPRDLFLRGYDTACFRCLRFPEGASWGRATA